MPSSAIGVNPCQLKPRLHSNGCTVSDRAWPSAIAGGFVQCTHPLVGGSRALPRLGAGLRRRLAPFFGKAKRCEYECLSSGATRRD